MTELLYIPATPGAPMACDMSTATDTPAERRAAYERLFEALVRREAACCPFADYRVEAAGDELIWTITAAAPAALDAFYALSA